MLSDYWKTAPHDELKEYMDGVDWSSVFDTMSLSEMEELWNLIPEDLKYLLPRDTALESYNLQHEYDDVISKCKPSYHIFANGSEVAFTDDPIAASGLATYYGNSYSGLIELKNEKGEVIWSKFNKSLHETLSE